MQAQYPPGQQHAHPYHQPQQSPQAPYPSNGIAHDIRPPHSEYGDPQPNGIMNPYQQYAAGYAQPPQHPQYAQQQPPPQQQHRPFMPNQLPPLGPPMPSSMPPVRDNPYQYPTSSTNSAQPSQYAAAPPPPMPLAQAHQTLPPPVTRAGVTTQHGEKKMFHSSTKDGFKYSLEVVQQPQRARMCGFGDKDRRPITPPPCVRLLIVDQETGREIDVNEIQSDPSFFVLQVDLWAESADREANVVRASSNSPAVSISSATTTSYPPPAEHPRHVEQPMMYMTAEGHPVYAPGYAMQLGRPGQVMYSQPAGSMFYPPVTSQAISYMPPAPSSNAMFTRNLIGSLTVNASRLTDNAGKVGYWFVLQDLSVRTEGFFRLRMSFIDISNHGAPGIIRGKAPVLAWAFSDKFQVYSAKKFPGVIESTPLSKCFAGQGIKIPIRKDNKGDTQDDDDGE